MDNEVTHFPRGSVKKPSSLKSYSQINVYFHSKDGWSNLINKFVERTKDRSKSILSLRDIVSETFGKKQDGWNHHKPQSKEKITGFLQASEKDPARKGLALKVKKLISLNVPRTAVDQNESDRNGQA